jgi:hypothetical protein
MSADWTTRHAICTVARRVLVQAVERALADPVVEWGDYPDLGEHDWDAVVKQVRHLANRTDVQTEHYDAAYRHLAERADTTEEETT